MLNGTFSENRTKSLSPFVSFVVFSQLWFGHHMSMGLNCSCVVLDSTTPSQSRNLAYVRGVYACGTGYASHLFSTIHSSWLYVPQIIAHHEAVRAFTIYIDKYITRF